ncbi:MAG: hypothetical protein KA419_07230 [Acidobacteria bacterium]|nr:hypothetical protein [Acidobacteriota bacterium]
MTVSPPRPLRFFRFLALAGLACTLTPAATAAADVPPPGPAAPAASRPAPAARDLFLDGMMRVRTALGPTRITRSELREAVQDRRVRGTVPVRVKTWPFLLTDQEGVVLVSLEAGNADLNYVRTEEGFRAELLVYGAIRTLDERKVQEFEDQLVSVYPVTEFQRRDKERSVYQKFVFLPPGNYKISLAAQDPVSGNLSLVDAGVRVPRPGTGRFALSVILPGTRVDKVDPAANPYNPFLLGDLKLIPGVSGTFRRTEGLTAYFQILPGPGGPAAGYAVRYEVRRGGEAVWSAVDPAGTPFHQEAPRRVVVVRRIPLDTLEAGNYTLKVTVTEAGGGMEQSVTTDFNVEGP